MKILHDFLLLRYTATIKPFVFSLFCTFYAINILSYLMLFQNNGIMKYRLLVLFLLVFAFFVNISTTL